MYIYDTTNEQTGSCMLWLIRTHTQLQWPQPHYDRNQREH